jgi:hypothetical protein
MKKTLIAVAAAAALATTSAFAEITFGTWLRAIAAPVASDGDDTVAFLGQSWGGSGRTAAIGINGVSDDEKSGFSFDVRDPSGTGLTNGDRAVMWVKPIDMLKLSFGKVDGGDDGLRGDFTFGSWTWLRPYNWLYDGEGLTFTGYSFGVNGGRDDNIGATIELDPIEGLHVVVAVPLESDIAEAENVYKQTQVALGYTIDGIGTIKAQWIGKNETIAKNKSISLDEENYYGDIEAAFDLKAVENLYLTVGGRFSLMSSNYYSVANATKYTLDKYTKDGAATKVDTEATNPGFAELAKVALGVSYNIMDGFTVFADGAVAFYNDVKVGNVTYKEDPRFSFGVGINYVIMDGLDLDADVRYLSKTTYNSGYKNFYVDEVAADASVSFMVGLTKNIGSSALLGIGFQGGNKVKKLGNLKAKDDFIWAVPVKMQIGF